MNLTEDQMELAKTEKGHSMPEKPLQMRSPEEIIQWLLTSETPLEKIEAREGRGGQIFYYLRHQEVTDTLNRICHFDWDFEILREWLVEKEDEITVLGKLTLRIGKVVISKCQYGSSSVKRTREDKCLSLGDDFKAAASDALKKCASHIGLGLDLSIPMRDNTRKALHATGREVFGEQWDEKRPWAIRVLTAGKKTSSTELLDVEARILIAVMKKEIHAEIVRDIARLLYTSNKPTKA